MAIVGPGITDEDYNSRGNVSSLDVFEGRIKSWILAFARTLAEQEDSGIAVLLLTSSVFEPMGGALIGGGNSEAKFCAGFLRAIPHVPGGNAAEVAVLVCDLLRNGLFHEAFIKAGLVLECGDHPVQMRSGAVVVNPRLFLDSVETAFDKTCDQIRSGDRKNFNAYWDKKLHDQGKYIEARLDAQIGPLTTSTGTAAIMPAHLYLKQM